MQIHGFVGVAHVPGIVQGKAHRKRLVALVHVEILDLLPGEPLAVQINGHLPGNLPKPQLQALCPGRHEGVILTDGHIGLLREGEYGVCAFFHTPGEHGEAENRILREGNPDGGPVSPEGHRLKGNSMGLRLISVDGVYEVLMPLGGKVAIPFLNYQRICRSGLRLVAFFSMMVNLNHWSAPLCRIMSIVYL